MDAVKKSSWIPAWWRGRTAVIGIPYGWLIVFFLLPFLIVFKYSISEMGDIRVSDLTSVADGVVKVALKYSNFVTIVTDDLYFHTYMTSVKYAGIVTVFTVSAYFPLIGLLTAFLPEVEVRRKAA